MNAMFCFWSAALLYVVLISILGLRELRKQKALQRTIAERTKKLSLLEVELLYRSDRFNR